MGGLLIHRLAGTAIAWLALPLLALAALSLAACGAPVPTATPTSTPAFAALSVEEIVAQAQEAVEAVTSYRYTWDMTRRHQMSDRRTSEVVLHEEGSWVAPGDLQADTTLTGDVDRHYQEIIVDGTAYARYLPGDGWRVHSPFQRRGQPYLPGNAEWRLVDTDATFEGEAVYHLEGTLEFEDDIVSMRSTVVLYVGKDDLLPRLVETASDNETMMVEEGTTSTSMFWATRYYDYNKPMTIEAPNDATPVPTPWRTPGVDPRG